MILFLSLVLTKTYFRRQGVMISFCLIMKAKILVYRLQEKNQVAKSKALALIYGNAKVNLFLRTTTKAYKFRFQA